jgi:hypothetical protein
VSLLEVVLSVIIIAISGTSVLGAIGATSLAYEHIQRIHAVTVAATQAVEKLEASKNMISSSTAEVSGIQCSVQEQRIAEGGTGYVDVVSATSGSTSQTLWFLSAP